MRPLADLIRESQKNERLHAIQGNEWYGWWTGQLVDSTQVFAGFIGRSMHYAEAQRQQMTHSELAKCRVGKPILHLALFDASGQFKEIQTRPDPLTLDPKISTLNWVGPEFDVAEMEEYLTIELGVVQRAPIYVYPFAIPEIELKLESLLSTQAEFLDNPSDYDEEEQESIREWIVEGHCELYFGNDYFLNSDGEVTSS
jgi:hypothetical protein